MLAPLKTAALASLAALLSILFAVNQSNAQSARNSLNSSRSGSLRNSYSGGISSSRSGGGGSLSQRSGLGQSRGGLGVNGRADANGASGQGGVGQGPMAAGLAQSVGERFQQGGFVGRDADDVRASFDSQSGGRGPGGMMDQMIENLNEMRDSRRRWREQNAAPPPIRVQLRPAFDLPAPMPAQSSVAIQTLLTKVMSMRGVGSPQIEFAGHTAILRGTVATAHNRELVERLAMLEPGVSQVENLVTIQEPPVP